MKGEHDIYCGYVCCVSVQVVDVGIRFVLVVNRIRQRSDDVPSLMNALSLIPPASSGTYSSASSGS